MGGDGIVGEQPAYVRFLMKHGRLILICLGILIALLCCLCCCRKAFYYLGCCFMCPDAACVQNLYGEKKGHVDPKKNKAQYASKIGVAETESKLKGIPSYYMSSIINSDYNSFAKKKETPAKPTPKATAIPAVSGDDIWGDSFNLGEATPAATPEPSQPEGEPDVVLKVSEPQE